MPVNYSPSLMPDTATPEGVAEWVRKELEALSQKLAEDDSLKVSFGTPPASASASGRAGTVIFGTDGYIYICSEKDTWIRAQATTWA